MNLQKQTIGLFLLVASLIIVSCRSNDTGSDLNKETVSVKVNISGSQYTDTSIREAEASTANNSIPRNTMQVQRKEIAINDDLTMVAELQPIATTLNKAFQAGFIKDITAGASDRKNLGTGIRYKLVVYNANGSYVDERNYIRGQETSTQDLKLNGGNNYTFVAYSVNSKTELPEVTYSDIANRTLATAVLVGIKGNLDLMYTRKDTLISENGTTYLGLVLKHKFSQIIPQIDATTAGYNIKEISANIDSHYPAADMELSGGAITKRSGATGNVNINFTGTGTMVVNGDPVLINGNTKKASLNISRITINNVTKTNFTPFNDLNIIPGIQYRLNIKINPKDVYLTYMEQPAARINGKIWMRHNSGEDIKGTNPDQNPSVRELHGFYYQWGRAYLVATQYMYDGPLANWNSSKAPSGSWVDGTKKNDPCPNGYRVPTRTEFDDLLGNTDQSNIGTWKDDVNNFSAAKVFRSKRNANVQLTFPIAGYRKNDTQGATVSRGWEGVYQTTSELGEFVYDFRIYNDGSSRIFGANNSWSDGKSIRCIAQ